MSVNSPFPSYPYNSTDLARVLKNKRGLRVTPDELSVLARQGRICAKRQGERARWFFPSNISRVERVLREIKRE